MSTLRKRIWNNGKLTEHIKVMVQKAGVVNTYLYDSETWTLHVQTETKISRLHVSIASWISLGKEVLLTCQRSNKWNGGTKILLFQPFKRRTLAYFENQFSEYCIYMSPWVPYRIGFGHRDKLVFLLATIKSSRIVRVSTHRQKRNKNR